MKTENWPWDVSSVNPVMLPGRDKKLFALGSWRDIFRWHKELLKSEANLMDSHLLSRVPALFSPPKKWFFIRGETCHTFELPSHKSSFHQLANSFSCHLSWETRVIVMKYGLVLSLPAAASLSPAGPGERQSLCVCHWVFIRSTADAVTKNVTSWWNQRHHTAALKSESQQPLLPKRHQQAASALFSWGDREKMTLFNHGNENVLSCVLLVIPQKCIESLKFSSRALG